jgi:hypothetical protein
LKTLANIVLPFFGVYELLPFSAIFVLPGRHDLRLRDFQFQTVFAAIGARPISPVSNRLQNRFEHRFGGDSQLYSFSNPDCLVGFPRRNDV